MKKSWIASIALALLGSTTANAEAIIKGHIRNVPDQEIGVLYREAVLNNTIFFRTELTGDSFEIRVKILDPTVVEFWIDQQHFSVFTLPDDLTVVDADAKDLSGSVQFKGTHTADNEFLLAMDTTEEGLSKLSRSKLPKDQQSMLLWNQERQKLAKERWDALFATVKHYKLSAAFKTNKIDGRHYRELGPALMAYFLATAPSAGIQLAGGFAMTKDQVDSMLTTVAVERPELLLNTDYTYFLKSYDMYLQRLDQESLSPEQLKKRTTAEWVSAEFAMLERHFKSEAVRYAVLVNMLGNGAASMESVDFTIWANAVLSRYPNGRHNDQLRNLIAGKRKLLPGGPAPAFALEDREGKTVSLASLKGKVVYLDFWGSWCIPCVYENRMVKAVKEANKGKDVVFVYITRDEDKKAWKEAIDKQELTGTHLYAGKSTVFPDYQADGVPHYVLIGKDGNIISSSAPRPSDKEKLQALLDAALQ